MRLPLSWLHDYVHPELDAAQLAQRLAMTGTEVDRIHYHGVRAVDRFVVGRVLEATQHPDADRLRVCSVDVGEGDAQQIVCGAPNVAAGQLVAVARPGAVMPDGTVLGTAKLRGIESNGMILAEDELAIGTDHGGILVLDELAIDAELAPGTPLADVLPIATDVLELEITPNRPDCLGVYGVAREVHAATGAPLALPPWHEDPADMEVGGTGSLAQAAVVVEVPELCPRFTARVFEDVTIAPSPPWLKARLMAAGQRPINNVVDITNYVMLLTGQPLHAFDLDRVAGARLIVRRAAAGERMTTLDDVVRVLDPDVVLIADDDGPTSIAGVMGGARSEVHPGTTRVLMEVATWNGPNINRTMAKLGLRTEAGSRFEKGLAPEQALEAQAVATRLMLALTGARLVPGTIDAGGPGPAARVIRLRDERVQGLLGTSIAREQSRGVLTALGFGVADADDGLDVSVPAFRRNDVTREADVIEEVARLTVLEALPATLPRNRTGHPGRLSTAQRLRRRAVDALTGCGLHEIVGWSFTDPGVVARLGLAADDPRARVVTVQNPMSEDQSVMRPALLGSLLDVARHNRARGISELGVFEYGATYRADGGADAQAARHPSGDQLPSEVHALGALVTGDVFAAKGVLEAVGAALRVALEIEAGGEPFLHPGRAARVLVDGEPAGWLGEIHPSVAARWDLERVAGFEVDLDAVIAAADALPHYRDLTSFPELRQDIAVVVGDDVPAASVIAIVRSAGAPLVASAKVFDVYTGEQVGAGRKSLALHLRFRAPDRTLTDEDVAPVREAIVAALAAEVGGELRA
jgi:phenylalanyl-tRNA synthetase beta chain